MVLNGIEIPVDKIAELCRRHGAIRLSLFGSILRDDFRPDSDVDMLVEFPDERRVDLFKLGGMLMDLSELLGRSVDLKTPSFLPEGVLIRVRRRAKVLYAA